MIQGIRFNSLPFLSLLLVLTSAQNAQPSNDQTSSTTSRDAQFDHIQSALDGDDPRSAYRDAVLYQRTYPADLRGEEICKKAAKALGKKYSETDASNSTTITEPTNCLNSDSTTESLFRQGKESFEKGDYAAAQKFFQQLMLGSPTKEDAYFCNAECAFRLGRYEEAANGYRQYFTDFPKGTFVAQAKKKEILSKRIGTKKTVYRE